MNRGGGGDGCERGVRGGRGGGAEEEALRVYVCVVGACEPVCVCVCMVCVCVCMCVLVNCLNCMIVYLYSC